MKSEITINENKDEFTTLPDIATEVFCHCNVVNDIVGTIPDIGNLLKIDSNLNSL